MKTIKIEINVENFGKMVAELYPEKAPKTVENFVNLVKSDFYSGIIFHRVIAGFMIQGGGFDEEFEQQEAEAIYGEFAANGFPTNDIHHARGVLSMARTNDPNSASSQFFIMHKDAGYLDRQYAAFGKVIEGIEVVDKIANVRTSSRGWYDDVPVENVVIENMKVIEE